MPDSQKNEKALLNNLSDHLIRIESMLTGKSAVQQSFAASDIEINVATLCVSKGALRSQPLTAKELQIISLLNGAEHRTLTRTSLVAGVWSATPVSAKTLDVHIFNLRRKLAGIGLGIVFMPPNCFRLMSIEVAPANQESQAG